MVMYEIKGAIGESWTPELVCRYYVAGSKPGAATWVGTAGDLVFSAGKGTRLGTEGQVVTCAPNSPTWRIADVEGGGSCHGRTWSVWRLIGVDDGDLIVSAAERERLEGRAGILRQGFLEWDLAAAANPGARMRDISAQRAEYEVISSRLATQGFLMVAFWLGYARRLGATQYLLLGY